jgi:sugar phosphate isomerase/epimerase
MSALIGVQMSTIKASVAELGVYEAMRRSGSIGYRSVEVSQVPMTPENIDALKRASVEFGVAVTSMSAAVEALAEDFDKMVGECRALGCDHLRIGILPLPLLGDAEGALAYIERAEAMAVRLRDEGITLSYHNHHVELRKHEGIPLLEHFRKRTEGLSFQLDVHWLHRGGVDPVDYLHRFAGRIPYLHLKDYRIAPFQMPEDRSTFLTAFHGLIEFAEVGDGNLPIAACIEAGVAGGCKHFYVEQDDTYGRDPYESLAISKANLIALGYEWF